MFAINVKIKNKQLKDLFSESILQLCKNVKMQMKKCCIKT